MDLMFRDQSKEVACKAQGIKHKAKAKDSASVSVAAPDCSRVLRKSVDPDISLASRCLYDCWSTLEVSAEQQAVCFFFSNYVMEPSKSGKYVYDCLPTFYNQESGKSPLSCATTALGLAGLSYRRSEPCLLFAAKSVYSSALHLTNEALRNPVTAVTDATLISVLLLGLYEVCLHPFNPFTCAELHQANTCTAPPSMRAWLKHISGATALLELRGKQQLDTEVGRRLFAYLCTQIANFSVLRRQPIPPTILRLSESRPATSEGYQMDITKKFFAISARHSILRAKIASSPSGTPATCTESVISEALSIAADLQNWHSNLPLEYYPTSTAKISSLTPEVFSDYYHIYSDVPTAMVMNNYLVLLILLHEMILIQSSHVRSSPIDINEENSFNYAPPPSYIAQIQRQVRRSQDAILNLIEQVCASVPFLLDYEYCMGVRRTLSEPHHPRAAGGNAIMWPLYACAQVYFVPNSTRAWIIGRLNKIGAEMGIQQAKVMAKILLQRTEITEVLAEDNELDDEYAATEESIAVLADRTRWHRACMEPEDEGRLDAAAMS